MPTFAPGEHVGQFYRVERLLAEGAVGAVYLAHDEALGRNVALKVLHDGVEPAEGTRLMKEAAALATLRNDHVVGVYAFGNHEGTPYIAMEYVEGRNLRGLIDEYYIEHRDWVPIFRAVQLLRDIADGMAAVHGAGIVHRDVKPENVVIEKGTGRVVIVDFGAAVVAADAKVGPVMGTPYYLSPEAAHGARPHPGMDIYSLGCLAYELLTGRGPFEADVVQEILLQHAKDPIPPVSSLRPGLGALDDLLSRSIAKKVSDRIASMAVFSNLLGDQLTPNPVMMSDDSLSLVMDRPDGGIRILVVDDDPIFARVAARCARLAMIGSNAEVSRASTGGKALANAQRHRPDIIVLDYMLPDIDGVEVLSRIRAGHDGDHPEVIVASGALGVAEQWRFGILGVTEFVDKPVEFTDLLAVIHRIAAKRGWTAERDATVAS